MTVKILSLTQSPAYFGIHNNNVNLLISKILKIILMMRMKMMKRRMTIKTLSVRLGSTGRCSSTGRLGGCNDMSYLFSSFFFSFLVVFLFVCCQTCFWGSAKKSITGRDWRELSCSLMMVSWSFSSLLLPSVESCHICCLVVSIVK